jgi:predicted GTPase
VDLNPTDKFITLLTQQKNAGLLLRVVSQGSIPIEIKSVESEMVANIVLADTPGTGDPHLVEAMARDFLPLCDLVLFFLSAANPFDTTDIPLLEELFGRLPFIPLMFVITRADEFRMDRRQPLSDNNFDMGKATTFLGGLISRINRRLGTAYKEQNFVFIDNEATFNIEVLSQRLMDLVDPTNIAGRLTMHSYKVKFFQSTAENLRDFFSSFLNDKLSELTSVVSEAAKNIRKYNEVVGISNTNLTHSWIENLEAIRDLGSRVSERLKRLDELPAALGNAKQVQNSLSSIRSEITRETRWGAERLEKHVMRSGFVQVQDQLSKIERDYWDPDLDNLNPQDFHLNAPRITWTFGEADIVPVSYLIRKADDHRMAILRCLNEAVADVEKALEDMQRAIHGRHVISRTEEIVHKAQASLENDFQRYFNIVQVYRVGVFSHNTKPSIAKLGIGAALDKLETEFTVEDKESITLETKQQLFPSFAEGIAETVTEFAAILDEIRLLLAEITQVKIERAPTLDNLIKSQLSEDIPIFFDRLANELQREAEDFLARAQTKFQSVLATSIGGYNSDLLAARRDRRNKYATAAALVAGIWVVIYILYVLIRRPVGQSAVEVVLWGLAINLVWEILVLGFIKFRDKFPATKSELKTLHIAKLREEMAQAKAELTRNYQFLATQPSSLGSRLDKVYATVLSSSEDAWNATAREMYEKIRNWNAAFEQLRIRYIAAINSLAKNCSTYFENPSKNLETLKEASEAIKQRAIEPSFKLLENTEQELNSVREELLGISFN